MVAALAVGSSLLRRNRGISDGANRIRDGRPSLLSTYFLRISIMSYSDVLFGGAPTLLQRTRPPLPSAS